MQLQINLIRNISIQILQTIATVTGTYTALASMAVRVKWKSKVNSKLKIVCWNFENARINLQVAKQISRKDSAWLWKDNRKSCSCIMRSQQQTQNIRMQWEIWKLSIANSSCHEESRTNEGGEFVNWFFVFVICNRVVFILEWQLVYWFFCDFCSLIFQNLLFFRICTIL